MGNYLISGEINLSIGSRYAFARSSLCTIDWTGSSERFTADILCFPLFPASRDFLSFLRGHLANE